MSPNDDWSPDEPLGTETFEQGDEALDDDPNLLDAVEQDPSLDPTLAVDELELEEAGVELDDPEKLVILDGGIDDPDGVGRPTGSRAGDEGGWDLDASLVRDDESDEDDTD